MKPSLRIGPELLRLASLVLALLVATVAPSFAAKKYEKIKAPKLRDVVLPQVTRVALDNGVQVFAVEDRELPLFHLRLTLKVGSAYDATDRLGLAAVTAGVLRSGGSEPLPGDRMDEVLESMGGSIETSTDALTTSISVDVLVEDTDRALEMLRDLLLTPAYPPDKVDLELKQWRSAIARRNDDPGEIASREMDKLLYGAAHPFARQTEYEHLDRIGRDDLLAFHRRWYHPQDAYLAVWGDFDTQAILGRLGAVLGAWPKTPVEHPEVPPVPETAPSLNLCVKESVNQSNIVLGHRGTTQRDPDYYALVVMNEILGGSFGSRLFNEVRSRQGLAYRVGSSLGAGLSYPGMFMVRSGTKSATTVQAVRACIDEVRKMKTAAITQAELERAKDGILNSHVFNFTDKGTIVNRQVSYVRNGYPADFLEKFPDGIRAVTVAEVQRAAAKYLQPERFAILVVGKPADISPPLATLGEVHEIDITIPVPAAAAAAVPAATPESLARGQEVLAAAAQAAGGSEALLKVTALTESANLTLTMGGQTIPGKIVRYARYPGGSRQEIDVMGQKIVLAYDAEGKSGFQSAGGQTRDLEGAQLSEAADDLARDLVACLRDPSAYSPQWIGESDVKGAKADIVLMRPTGLATFKLFVDRTTHRIVKQEYRGMNMQGVPVAQEVFLEDYRKAGPLLLPHKTSVMQDGQPAMGYESTGFSWEPIPAEKFKKG